MLKNILILSSIFALASCQSVFKKTSDTTIENKSDEKEVYQTIESEEQAAQLNQEAETAVQEIEVQDRIFFDYDSSGLSDDAKKILDTQVAWLKSDTSIKVTIEGHCDERGTREYNIALGDLRANTAKKYLVENGIEEARIRTVSYGKERPAFFGTDPKLLAKNRRAVTIVGQE